MLGIVQTNDKVIRQLYMGQGLKIIVFDSLLRRKCMQVLMSVCHIVVQK